MSRLPRPYISISVRCRVAFAQLLSLGVNAFPHSRCDGETLLAYLNRLLALLAEKLGAQKLELHHRPALLN